MAWTPEKEAEYQSLLSQIGGPAPSPEPRPSLLGRFGMGLANIPSGVAQGASDAGRTLFNFGQPEDMQLGRANVPKPFDIPEPTSLKERLTDLGPGIATALATAFVPGALAVRGARLLGAGSDAAAIMGDVAGGGFLGLGQSPEEAATTGAEFGALGAAQRFIPSPLLRAAVNVAIPVGGQLLRGQNPLDQQSLINTGTNVLLPALMGHYARRGDAISDTSDAANPGADIPPPNEPASTSVGTLGPYTAKLLSSEPSTPRPLMRTPEAPPEFYGAPTPEAPPEVAPYRKFDPNDLDASQAEDLVYHGTRNGGFDKFEGPDDADIDYNIPGTIYFSSDRKTAEHYAEIGSQRVKNGATDYDTGTSPEIYAARLNFKQPLDFSKRVSEYSPDQMEALAEVGGASNVSETVAEWADNPAKAPKVSRWLSADTGTLHDLPMDRLKGYFDGIKDPERGVHAAFSGDQVEIVRREPYGPDASVTTSTPELPDIQERIMSRTAEPTAHHADVERAVREVAEQYPGVDVSVMRNERELPDDVKARINPDAFYEGLNDGKNGRQYILSDNIPDEQRAREVAIHEVVGHYGVDKIAAPEDWKGIQSHVLGKGGDLRDEIASTYTGGDVTSEAARTRIAREYVARVAENTNLDPTLWQNITATVRKALRAAGIRREWSDAEIADLIRRAHKNLKKGDFNDVGSDAVSAARIDQKNTPKFKQWFGDSKVVDANGNPIVVYHGTSREFKAFDTSKLGSSSGSLSSRKGFFFTNDPGVASEWADASQSGIGKGGNVIPAYLSLRNPLVYDFKGKIARDHVYADILSKAKRDGHDGAIFKNTFDNGTHQQGASPHDIFISFSPNQIKSAIGNTGEFDRSNPNIDASIPRHLNDAARDQEEGKKSLLGGATRKAEQLLGLSQSPEIKRAREMGVGQEALLAKRQSDLNTEYLKDKPLLTPDHKEAIRLFQQSDPTPASVALLKSANLPKSAENLALGSAEIKKQAQAVIAKGETKEHRATIEKSDGYQRRAYQLFADPKSFLRRMGKGDYETPIKDATAYFKSRPEFKGVSDFIVERAVRQYVNDIASGTRHGEGSGGQKISQALYATKHDLTPEQWRTMEALRSDARLSPADQDIIKEAVSNRHLDDAQQARLQQIAEGGVLGKNLSETLQAIGDRETVAPEIRRLFGEYTDPIEQAAFTAQKLIGNVKQATTLAAIADSTTADGRKLSYSTPQEYEAAIKTATGDAKRALLRYKQIPKADGYGVLSGRWSDIGVHDALDTMNQGMDAGGNRFFAKLQSVMKANATILNPATHAHNWMQLPFMMAIGRVYNPADWARATKLMNDPTFRDELTRNHVIGAGMGVNEVGQGAKSIANITEPGTILEKAITGKDKAMKWVAELYNKPDDIVRAATYMRAKERAVASGLAGKEAESAAMDFTNRYTWNYHATAPIVNILKNVPGINPFLSYSAELVRVVKNLGEDVLHGNSTDRTHAALNLALMAGVPLALQMGSEMANLSQDDQREWSKLRGLEPENIRSQIKMVMGRKKDGTFNYFDVKPVLPASDLFTLARSLVNGDWKTAISEQPIVGLSHNPLMALGTDLSAGENTFTGEKFQTAGDYAKRIYTPLVPPILGNQGQRILRGFTPNSEGGLGLTNPRTGRVDDPTTATIGTLGMRLNSENPSALMRSAVYDKNEQIRAAHRKLMQVQQTNATPEAKGRALMRYSETVQEINDELARKTRQ